MVRRYRQFLVLIASFMFNLVVIDCPVYAQPTVEIRIEADIDMHTLHIGSELREIKLIASPNQFDLRFEWILNGPGELTGEATTDDFSSIFYKLPDKIDEESTQATITVTVSNDAKEKASKSITFTLLDETLEIENILSQTTQQQLEIADNYFEERKWMIPEKMNAFKIYKLVLKGDPDNARALQKIREIMQGYKSWGDENYEDMSRGRDRQVASDYAKTYYQRYLQVTQYLVETLGTFTISNKTLKTLESEGIPVDILNKLEHLKDQETRGKEAFINLLKDTLGNESTANYETLILTYADVHQYPIEKEEVQEMQKRLKKLEDPQSLYKEIITELQRMLPDKFERYKRLKEKEQQNNADMNTEIIAVIREMTDALQEPEEMPTSDLDQIKRLRKQADTCFSRQRFTAPPGENAFELYQEVLALDPANRHAQERLYEIASTYKEWEAQVTKQNKSDPRAKIYRSQYQLVMEEFLQNLDDQFTQAEDKLVKAQKNGDTNGEIVQTLRMLETLREIKEVYTQFSQNTSEMKGFIERLDETIDSYEQNFLGQTIEQEE